MEKIEALVDVLGKFGEELGNVKDLIADIQEVVLKQTSNLKKELTSFKESLKKSETDNTKATHFSEAEKEIQERVQKLKVEIGKLEILRQKKEESLRNNNNSVNGVSKHNSATESLMKIRLASSPIEEAKTWKPTWTENYGYQSSRASSSPVERLVVQPYQYNKAEVNNHQENTSPLPEEWWTVPIKHKHADEYIDWKKEYEERKQCRQNLMIKEGWKKTNSSHEDLEAVFQMWTGKSIKWTVLKRGKQKPGKALFNVRFERMEDREKVLNMRKEIAEEGYLFVGEELSHIERKERWTMLMMAERLRSEGKNVEFENRRICVDAEWWKYDWVDGWKRV